MFSQYLFIWCNTISFYFILARRKLGHLFWENVATFIPMFFYKPFHFSGPGGIIIVTENSTDVTGMVNLFTRTTSYNKKRIMHLIRKLDDSEMMAIMAVGTKGFFEVKYVYLGSENAITYRFRGRDIEKGTERISFGELKFQ